jgi:hypothetical protein
MLYRDYAPTAFDHQGAFMRDRHDWSVCPCGVNRDSDSLDQSNFATALTMLGGESETVEVHSFNHWAVGWLEIILISPHDYAAQAALATIIGKLENYPVLDEDDYIERQYARATEAWQHMSTRDRIYACHEHGASIFAARHDGLPHEHNGELEYWLADGH